MFYAEVNACHTQQEGHINGEVNKPVESDLIEVVAPVAVVEIVAGVGAEAATVAASGVLPELPVIKVLTLA